MTEHVECSNILIVNRFLESLPLLITFGKQFDCFVVAVLDMPQFLDDDVRQDALQWQIAATVEFFQVISSDAID